MNDRFDAAFRKRLIVALCADPDFFRKAVDFLKPEMIIERPIQFAYSVLLRLYEREGKLPSAEVLHMAALDDFNNPEIPFDQKPSANELDDYIETVSMAAASRQNPSCDQTAYMSSKLKDFLQMCYMAAIPNEATTSQRLEMYSQIYSQMQTYDSTASGNEMTLEETLRHLSETVDIRNRIGTGLPCVDVPLNGGLAPGEIGLIIAPSGVGKSNAMINFACENILRGNESMYISLELSRETIYTRLIAMMTGIRASLISKGITPEAMKSWTESERRRYTELTTPSGKNWPLLKSIKVIAYTDRHVTTDTLKQEVVKWKEERIKAGVSESKLGFVAVDWLNNIDPSSLSMLSKNQNQAYIMEKVTEALRQMGASTDTRVWTAQQAARNALNKEVLTMQDGRDSSGTFNPVDIAMGLAIKKEIGEKGAPVVKITSSGDKVKLDPDREMLWSIMKDRNSGATGACIKFYQGPSLKFFESKKECQRAELINQGATK